jgi:hypothetical protein
MPKSRAQARRDRLDVFVALLMLAALLEVLFGLWMLSWVPEGLARSWATVSIIFGGIAFAGSLLVLISRRY